MVEAAAETPPPRNFESGVLSESDSQRVTHLLSFLKDNSYAYQSHVELIDLLHKGFLAHTASSSSSPDRNDANPHAYTLLTELRQAREAMDTRFAVGENIWDDWLSDEIMLASSSEERINVTDLFSKAVQDEPASVKLWQMYAGWVWNNFDACNSTDGADQSKWTDEDKELCKELFTRDMVINVLEQALGATQWRIDQSHVIWNRYAELVQEGFPQSPSNAETERLRDMYVNRLQLPHATWEETNQMFWSVISKYESSNWEAVMAQVHEMTASAKRQMELRQPNELALQRALEGGDRNEAFEQFSQYLRWEKRQERKQNQRSIYDAELRRGLYERALLQFPTHAEWWLDYIDFVTSAAPSSSTLSLNERATRHCPWSGDLWARLLLQADVEGKPHQEIEALKHRATNSGLLDIGGMEEVVKVLQQWCSYLRRQAFSHGSSEDDLDIAEAGITLALEDIYEAGKKIYGADFQGDPLARLEQIQIKFLSEARRFDDARQIYKSLVKTQKNSYDFWSKYYNWEIWLWGYDRVNEAERVETPNNGPDKATAVLREALSQRNLDEPEKILTLYINHFQLHEATVRLRAALVEARDFSNHLAVRRAKEAEDAAEAVRAAQQDQITPAINEINGTAVGEKRKREDEEMMNGHDDKKSRTEESISMLDATEEASASAAAQVKRDREHNTVTVKNLPSDVAEKDVKKFFRDIGEPISILLNHDADNGNTTAIVEFSSHEDVLAAKTRSGKVLGDKEVSIQSGSQSTLYVANYPEDYDEAAIRKLFSSYGEIISVRFPSLKYNNRRRFCYVSFATQDMAKAAEAALDTKMLDGTHQLLAKISDPDAKKQRSGAQAEGRELFVRNLDRDAAEADIRAFFSHHGTIQSLNLVKSVAGKKLGTAFIVYSSPAEVAAAVAAANNKPFHDRILQVEVSSSKGRAPPLERAHKEDVIISQHQNPSAPSNNPLPAADDSTARARKIALLHLPDTVNDARILSLLQPYGQILKIQLRRDKEGAIVEFADVQVAFNVRQGVDCGVLGQAVRTGDVGELLAKPKKGRGGFGGMVPAAAAVGQRPRMQRGGRRGGLGFKRGGMAVGGGGGGGGVRSDGESAANIGGGGDEGKSAAGAKKSNADFRSMFTKSEEGAAGAKEEWM